MKVTIKNLPKLSLKDVLRRRKMTLRNHLDEFGITTYDGLMNRCNRVGILPPTKEEFLEAYPDEPVNNPQEGIVVLDVQPQIATTTTPTDDSKDSEYEVGSWIDEPLITHEQTPIDNNFDDSSKKKSKRKGKALE